MNPRRVTPHSTCRCKHGTHAACRLQQRLGLTFLLIGHDLAVIQRMSHDVLVMKAGEGVEYRPAADLFESPEQEYTRALFGGVPPAQPRRALSDNESLSRCNESANHRMMCRAEKRRGSCWSGPASGEMAAHLAQRSRCRMDAP